MHSFDLNLDLVNGEEEERTEALGSSDDEEEELNGFIEEALGSSEEELNGFIDDLGSEEELNGFIDALGSSDEEEEELNGFIDYFLHGHDSDVSQSNQGRRLPEEEESISGSRVRNGGMDLDVAELGLGLGLGFDSDTNNEAPFDLNVSVSDIEMFEFLSGEEEEEAVQDVENEFSSSSMSEVELVCEEDFQVVRDVNYNDAMMIDHPPDELFSNYNDEVDIEEGLGMIINAAVDEVDEDDNGEDIWGDIWRDLLPALWLEWDNDDNYTSPSMQTVRCDVDNLPSITLTQEELNKNNSICAICMENFCIEEKLKRLPCFHYYHVDCISPWLRTRNTCPTCRYELPPILSL